MFLECLLNIAYSIFYFIIGIIRAYWGFLLMPGAPQDKKLHCWFCCGITTLAFIILMILRPSNMFMNWIFSALMAIICALAKECILDFWLRGVGADFEDILAGLRGIGQSSIWIWTYMAIRDRIGG